MASISMSVVEKNISEFLLAFVDNAMVPRKRKLTGAL
jgi:hypothetical protein